MFAHLPPFLRLKIATFSGLGKASPLPGGPASPAREGIPTGEKRGEASEKRYKRYRGVPSVRYSNNDKRIGCNGKSVT